METINTNPKPPALHADTLLPHSYLATDSLAPSNPPPISGFLKNNILYILSTTYFSTFLHFYFFCIYYKANTFLGIFLVTTNMANEAHYHEFLKLINVSPTDVTDHIIQRYQDFINFFTADGGNLSVDQAFQKWCNIKILEQPTIAELISPIKSNNLVWDADFTEIIETLQTSSSPIKRLPTLPSPEVNTAKRAHSFSPNKWESATKRICSPTNPQPPPPPPPTHTPPHTKHIVGHKTMENLNKLRQKIKKPRKTVGRPSRMETLSKLANNTTLFQKTLYLVAQDNKVKKTLPILTTGNNNLQCTDENDFKIFEYITKEIIEKEKEKLVNLMYVEEKLNCQEQNSNKNM